MCRKAGHEPTERKQVEEKCPYINDWMLGTGGLGFKIIDSMQNFPNALPFAHNESQNFLNLEIPAPPHSASESPPLGTISIIVLTIILLLA
jgi:hypothetical protein